MLASLPLLLVAVVLWVDTVAGGDLVDHPVALLAAVAAGYAAGAWARVAWSLLGVCTTAVVLTWANQIAAPGEYHPLDDLMFFLILVGAPALAGAALTARRRQVRELTDLTTRLLSQRSAAVSSARLQERNRVQLEVHRQISEQLTAVVLRAEGGLRDSSAESARQTLVELEGAARDSLDQLRATLGSLRDAPAPAPEPTGPTRSALPRWRGDWRDLALAAGCAVAASVEMLAGSGRDPAWANVVAAVLMAAPLAARRGTPVAAASGFTVTALATSLVLTPVMGLVTGIALVLLFAYAVAAYSRWWPVGSLILLAGAVVMHLTRDGRGPDDGLLPTVFCLVLATAAGLVGASGIRRTRLLREAVQELELGREIDIAVARAEQRAGLAQELHDSVAHTMTVVCLQAVAGQRTHHPEALSTIVAVAREGLTELREGIEALDADMPPEDAIRAAAVRAGLHPTVVIDAPSLDPVTWALAARIVREALVNAGRYAHDAAVDVRIVGSAEELEISVADSGGRGGFAHGAGTGLAGLSTKVTEAGGDLHWGPEGAGFAVRARLPLRQPVPS